MLIVKKTLYKSELPSRFIYSRVGDKKQWFTIANEIIVMIYKHIYFDHKWIYVKEIFGYCYLKKKHYFGKQNFMGSGLNLEM